MRRVSRSASAAVVRNRSGSQPRRDGQGQGTVRQRNVVVLAALDLERLEALIDSTPLLRSGSAHP